MDGLWLGARNAQPPVGEGRSATMTTSVVILNQYYAPDVASTGHLLHELATDLAHREFAVKVLTCRPCYGPPETWKPCKLEEMDEGVHVKRMVTTRYSKDRMLGRAINALTFIVPLTLRMLFGSKRRDVHLYTTNPPFLGSIGMVVSLLRRHRYVVLLHDAYPQLAVWVGKIKGKGFIDRVWHFLNKHTYRRAERTIVLCEAAKKLVCDTYGVNPDRVHVIPNWADGTSLGPKPKAGNPFAVANGLVEPFVVMYSGNLGLYYEFETVLAAADKLRNENFKLVLIGAGGRRAWIAEQIQKMQLTNTTLLPYQPLEKLPDSLTACDSSLVTIAKGIEGISFPSKLYTSLAVGKPILAISESPSELKDIVEGHGVGRWCELGDSDGLVEVIRTMMNDPERCAREGRAARELFERQYQKSISCGKYADVLRLASPDTMARKEALA